MIAQWWRRFRNIDRVDVLTEEIQRVSRESVELRADYDSLLRDLDRERDRRIGAETVAKSHEQVIEYWKGEVVRLHEQNAAILSERLKSLDALNVRLMEPRVETPPPDLSQYKRMTSEQSDRALSAIRQFRQANDSIDRAIFQKHYPQFMARVVPNLTEQPAETPAETLTENIA